MRLRRSVALVTLVFSACLVEGRPATANQASWTDEVGEVPRCDGDIASVEVSYSDRVTLTSSPRCGSDPVTDQRWASQDLSINWHLDVDGDQYQEFEIYFGWASGGSEAPHLITSMRHQTKPQPNGTINSGPTNCEVTVEPAGSMRHQISFAKQCIVGMEPDTGVMRVRAEMMARNPAGNYFNSDSAPLNGTGGWSTPVAWSAPPPPPPQPPPPPRSGYWMVGSSGTVYGFGDATVMGDAPTSAAEDLEPTPTGDGYWIVTASGVVYIFGNATHFGGIEGRLAPFEKVTSISATPTSGGYWLFTSLGRVVAFGDAAHLGDMAGTRLNGPVLDSVPTPSGRGYYMVASDGGIFTFGDASFFGSMGDAHLNAPVQSLVPDTDRAGYWLVASDGGIFAFEADFYGSMGDTRLNRPITGMVASGPGGYLMVGEDGGIFTFGSAAFHGSLGDRPPSKPITSVAVMPR